MSNKAKKRLTNKTHFFSGFYLPTRRSSNITACLSCSAGYFCNATGLSAVSGPCTTGYYCPGGQATSTPIAYQCPVGHFCVEGSSAAQICTSGYYQVRCVPLSIYIYIGLLLEYLTQTFSNHSHFFQIWLIVNIYDMLLFNTIF